MPLCLNRLRDTLTKFARLASSGIRRPMYQVKLAHLGALSVASLAAAKEKALETGRCLEVDTSGILENGFSLIGTAPRLQGLSPFSFISAKLNLPKFKAAGETLNEVINFRKIFFNLHN